MKLSVRTLLLLMATVGFSLGIFMPMPVIRAAWAVYLEPIVLLGLLPIVCSTFASAADDLWQTPEFTFVAALFGFLGFSAIVTIGMLVPTGGY